MSTPTNKFNILIQQGATYHLTVTMKNPDGSLMNLTGFTSRMMVRQDYGDVAPVVSITDTPNAQGSLTLGGAAGTVAIKIEAVATAALPANNYVWDIELVNGTEVMRPLQGSVVVSPEVTK